MRLGPRRHFPTGSRLQAGYSAVQVWLVEWNMHFCIDERGLFGGYFHNVLFDIAI